MRDLSEHPKKGNRAVRQALQAGTAIASFRAIPVAAKDGEVPSYPPHPACLVWPSMPKDQLNELANNIQLHGLIEPITLFGGKFSTVATG
jgi:hypothetical protein